MKKNIEIAKNTTVETTIATTNTTVNTATATVETIPTVKVSTTVSKLGGTIPTVNLPAGITCRPDAPCAKQCYALRGNFTRNNVKARHAENLDAYLLNPKTYFETINRFLKAPTITYKYFRWHSSGDIVDMQYLHLMCQLAKKNRSTRFLCFTKKYELCNSYIEKGGVIPKNLIIVWSMWGEFGNDIPNPNNFPKSYVRFKKQAERIGEEYIPNNANSCTGKCVDCITEHKTKSCWFLKEGGSVVFKKH